MATMFSFSQLPVVSLTKHRCVLLTWLPFSVCLQHAEETVDTNLHTSASQTVYTVASSNAIAMSKTNCSSEGPLSNMCGFERRLFQAVSEEAFVPMHHLRGVFPSNSEYYTEDAVLAVSVQLASDVSALSSSQWVRLEAYREVAVLVVVLNCHGMDLQHATSAVGNVAQRYLCSDAVWRCVLLDPPTEMQQDLLSTNMFVAYTNTPVSEVSKNLLREISLSIAHRINGCIVALQSSSVSQNSHSAATDLVKKASETSSDSNHSINNTIPVPGAASSVGASAFSIIDFSSHKKHVINSVLAKRKGDVLLQLGALDAALLSYAESLANVDPLWTSATLESVAAVRYMQNSSLFSFASSADTFFSLVESCETVWSDAFDAMLAQIESITAKTRADQRKASALMRSSVSAGALGKKLAKEVDEPIAQHNETLRRLVASIRSATSPEHGNSRNLSDSPSNVSSPLSNIAANASTPVNLESVGREARNAFYLVLSVTYRELQMYLQEALQQLRGVSGGASTVVDRAADIHLKRTELLAAQGDRVRFVKSLAELTEAVRLLPEPLQWKMRGLFPGLCMLCGCERKGILYILDMAAARRQAQDFAAAIRLQAQACRTAGIPLPLLDMRGGNDFSSDQWIVTQLQEAHRDNCSDSAKEGVGRRARMQDVSLLMDLLDILVEAGVSGGPQSTVASLLLFEYYPFLERETQQTLMNFIERCSVQQEPNSLTPPALLASMDVLALPPHLAPKTVPLSGAQFTFIDMSRLRMTVLTLNGKILPPGQIVWCAGDVGEVEITLTNPLLRDLQLTSIALSCRSVSTADVNGKIPDEDVGHVVGPLAPSSYVVTGVILPSLSKRRLLLQVRPNIEGYLIIEGVDVRLGQLFTCSFLMPSIKPIMVPVIQQLPFVTCTLGVSELEIFAGQTKSFPLHVTNAGALTLRRLYITAHDESCQLEECTGCKERPDDSALYVSLERDPDLLSETVCLVPGETHTMCVTITALSSIDSVVFQHIVFRVAVELPHDRPESPENVTSSVPVFAVIPRRIQETYLRVFHVPGVVLTLMKLSRDQRYLDITVKNKSCVYTTELLCSEMFFTNLPDVLVVPGADFLIPPIEIACIPHNVRQFALPWVVRELPSCRGTLMLDFSVIDSAVVCTEPLEDALVSVCLHEDSEERWSLQEQLWSNASEESKGPLVAAALRPILLTVSVSAQWKSVVSIRIRLESDIYLDADFLSGPVDVTTQIGDNGKVRYEEVMEYFSFKTGDHVVSIRLSDPEGREVLHSVGLQVQRF